jgi:hypothetical protein
MVSEAISNYSTTQVGTCGLIKLLLSAIHTVTKRGVFIVNYRYQARLSNPPHELGRVTLSDKTGILAWRNESLGIF